MFFELDSFQYTEMKSSKNQKTFLRADTIYWSCMLSMKSSANRYCATLKGNRTNSFLTFVAGDGTWYAWDQRAVPARFILLTAGVWAIKVLIFDKL